MKTMPGERVILESKMLVSMTPLVISIARETSHRRCGDNSTVLSGRPWEPLFVARVQGP
jgi:hypothetical protein